jgi:hypothetical protein
MHLPSRVANTAGGSILLVSDSSGKYFGGWTFSIRNSPSVYDYPFGQAVTSMKANSDGTSYSIETPKRHVLAQVFPT